jgi:hypothetical protein
MRGRGVNEVDDLCLNPLEQDYLPFSPSPHPYKFLSN